MEFVIEIWRADRVKVVWKIASYIPRRNVNFFFGKSELSVTLRVCDSALTYN